MSLSSLVRAVQFCLQRSQACDLASDFGEARLGNLQVAQLELGRVAGAEKPMLDGVSVKRATAVIGVRPATVFSREHCHVLVSQSQS